MIDPIAAGCPKPMLRVEWPTDEATIDSPITVFASKGHGGAIMEQECALNRVVRDESLYWSVYVPVSVGSVSLWTVDMKPIWQDGIFTLSSVKLPSHSKSLIRSSGAVEQVGDDVGEKAPRRRIPQHSCYVVDASITFRGLVDDNIPIKLSLCDAVTEGKLPYEHQYEPYFLDSVLIPGLPSQIELKCRDININAFSASLSASVASSRELDSIEAKFIDCFGNTASVNTIKACKV